MINKTLLALLGVLTSTVIAMEKPKLKEWVLKAKTVNVSTSLQKIDCNIDITNDTVIADLKKEFEDSEGVPSAMQQITPLVPSEWTFGFTTYYGPYVSDNSNVKEVMNCWNTGKFIVWLSTNTRVPQDSDGGN